MPRMQFGTRQLTLMTLVYSLLFAILAALHMSPIPVLAASGVVTLFVAGDLLCGTSGQVAVPIHARAAYKVAKYASSFALAMTVCFVLSSVSVLAGSTREVDFVTSLAMPIGLFAAFCTIAFVAAIAASPYYTTASWYLFFNAPGVTLLGMMAYAAALRFGFVQQ